MDNIISLPEIRIRRAIKEATLSLRNVRKMISEGKKVPPDLIPRLEAIILDLEEQLTNFIENGY